MKLSIEIVKPSVLLITPPEWILKMAEIVEYCGRLCHKTEELAGEKTDAFIQKVARKLHHESIEEHSAITFHFVGSRSFSHQLVRHRLDAISQESQRYCDYSHPRHGQCLQVICPPKIASVQHGVVVSADLDDETGWPVASNYEAGPLTVSCEHRVTCGGPVQLAGPQLLLDRRFTRWATTQLRCYWEYLTDREDGVPAEDARFSLPNAAKTEVAFTASIRQWRHIIEMRCDKHAQWEIRELTREVLRVLNQQLPACFGDLAEKYGV